MELVPARLHSIHGSPQQVRQFTIDGGDHIRKRKQDRVDGEVHSMGSENVQKEGGTLFPPGPFLQEEREGTTYDGTRVTKTREGGA